jgi:sugar/nucleoside kinase (ribokinase family)
LIPSKEFVLGFTKQDNVEKAMKMLKDKYNPEILVITDGGDGGYYLEDGLIKHYDSVKVEVLDTNGAGDTFHGAFIVAYCDGKTLKECCDFASKVAAYKCMHKGARTFELNKRIIDEYFK